MSAGEPSTDVLIGNYQKMIDEIDERISTWKTERSKLVEQRNELVNKNRLAKSLAVSTTKWDGHDFKWTNELKKTMSDIFQLKKFRPQQLKVINAFMAGQDVLLISPTGGGKSLCYQLPGVCAPGLTLVVSPLIALMKDQLWALQKLGIKADMLYSGTEKAKTSIIHKQIREGSSALKLLYVSPELLAKSKRLMSSLQAAYVMKNISGIAIGMANI